MAGTHIELEIEDQALLQILDGLEARAERTAPAWQEIGDYLIDAHEARWELAISPDGEPWDALDPVYQRRKQKNQDKILVLDGHLRDTLAFTVEDDGLEFGSNRVYAATHQFGREDDGIPARPFLGLSEDDNEEVLEILTAHVVG